MMLGYLPLQHPPEELRVRARDIVRSIGHTESPADVETAFRYDERHAATLAGAIRPGPRDTSRDQWRAALARRPWPLYFRYQQSAVPLIRTPPMGPISGYRAAPAELGDIALVSVDVGVDGRLLRLDAAPPSGAPPTPPIDPPWPALFTAAGLDIGRFEAAIPTSNVAVADVRAAWTGSYPGADETRVRVEAASLHGQPTLFAVLFPWSDPLQQEMRARPGTAMPFAATLLNFLVYVGFALVARHNLKQGRGDTRGAWRVGAYIGMVLLVMERLAGVGDPREPFIAASLRPMAAGLTFALAYLAVEPWTRRIWPHKIITWSRLVAGRWRDPLVARDFLTAVACVTASYALLRLVQFAAVHAGEAPLPPGGEGGFGIALNQLLGGGSMLATIVRPLLAGLSVSVAPFFCMFVAFALLRRKWVAAVAYVVMGTLMFSPTILSSAWIHQFQWLLEITFLLFLTLRFGILAAAIFSCLSQILSQSALTYRFDEWYGQSSLVAAAIVAAVALYGLHVSLAGRPLLRGLERVKS